MNQPSFPQPVRQDESRPATPAPTEPAEKAAPQPPVKPDDASENAQGNEIREGAPGL